MDCAGAVFGASLSYSVLQTVGPDRFDRAMGKEGQDNQNLVIGKRVDEGMIFDLIQFPVAHAIDDLLPGDAVYFKNTEDIHRKHPGLRLAGRKHHLPWQRPVQRSRLR